TVERSGRPDSTSIRPDPIRTVHPPFRAPSIARVASRSGGTRAPAAWRRSSRSSSRVDGPDVLAGPESEVVPFTTTTIRETEGAGRCSDRCYPPGPGSMGPAHRLVRLQCASGYRRRGNDLCPAGRVLRKAQPEVDALATADPRVGGTDPGRSSGPAPTRRRDRRPR